MRTDDPAVSPLTPVAGFRRCYVEEDGYAPAATITDTVTDATALALGCPRAPERTRCHGIAPAASA